MWWSPCNHKHIHSYTSRSETHAHPPIHSYKYLRNLCTCHMCIYFQNSTNIFSWFIQIVVTIAKKIKSKKIKSDSGLLSCSAIIIQKQFLRCVKFNDSWMSNRHCLHNNINYLSDLEEIRRVTELRTLIPVKMLFHPNFPFSCKWRRH